MIADDRADGPGETDSSARDDRAGRAHDAIVTAASVRPEDKAAFEHLYRRHRRSIYRYTLAVLANPQDAEDATQTTFMQAYRALAAGRPPRQPDRWLLVVARNVCRQRFREQRQSIRVQPLYDRIATVARDPAEPDVAELRQALSLVPEPGRTAVLMREFQGRSYLEIGEALGLTDAAVQRLVQRSKQILRKHLEADISCVDARSALVLSRDGALEIGARRELLAHLGRCAACADVARELGLRRRSPRLPLLLPSFLKRAAALLGGTSPSGTTTSALAAKVAAMAVTGAIVGGVGHESAKLAAPSRHAGHRSPVDVHAGSSSRRTTRTRDARRAPPRHDVRPQERVSRPVPDVAPLPTDPAARPFVAEAVGPAANLIVTDAVDASPVPIGSSLPATVGAGAPDARPRPGREVGQATNAGNGKQPAHDPPGGQSSGAALAQPETPTVQGVSATDEPHSAADGSARAGDPGASPAPPASARQASGHRPPG